MKMHCGTGDVLKCPSEKQRLQPRDASYFQFAEANVKIVY